ncbi:MAG: hypothetical protein GY856_50740 [bacterium]|nr:hypothetical protein [bacterium]
MGFALRGTTGSAPANASTVGHQFAVDKCPDVDKINTVMLMLENPNDELALVAQGFDQTDDYAN